MAKINWNLKPARLLSPGDYNTKLAKGIKRGYLTAGLVLAPHKTAGRGNVCTMATFCISPCLHESGHATYFSGIIDGRIRRTRLWFDDREWFLGQLEKDLEYWTRKSSKARMPLCVRLNVLSDISWENAAPWVFDDFPTITYYDYTKVYKRLGNTPTNYHLTFSWSGTNIVECRQALSSGFNVAVPFEVFPETFLGHSVVNGDETDLRFLDSSPRIVGLRAKGKARTDKSGFVVRPDMLREIELRNTYQKLTTV